MQRINYRSDFDFILHLRDCRGQELPFPTYDFMVKLVTDGGGSFIASQVKGVKTNCYDDEGKLHIVCNAHKLPPGNLRVSFEGDIPDDIFPDGKRFNVTTDHLPIALVIGKADVCCSVDAQLVLPTLKGDPFLFQDFTPEQIKTLQRPAIEAAMDVQNKINDYNASEEKRIENEDRRIRFEQVRVEAEDGRVKAETARAEAEKNREQHTTEVSQDMVKATEEVRKTNVDVQRQEEVRQTQEGNRERAENTRLTQENTRKEGETARERSENARSTQESIRQTNEQNRQQGEEGRVNAERGRVTAEQTRVQADTKRQQGFTEAVQNCVNAVKEVKATEALQQAEEAKRVQAETGRVQADSERQQGFTAAVAKCDKAVADVEAAEARHERAEQARTEAEQARQEQFTATNRKMQEATTTVEQANASILSQEADRVRAEEARQQGFEASKFACDKATASATKAESDIRQTEQGRVQAEQSRVQADTERQQGFTEAVDSCTKAVQSCTAAVEEVKEAEKHHEASEASRVEAEKKRVEGFSASKTACDQATADANKVIERANTFITPSGDPMHYAYETAGAKWNAKTGYWEMNELTDLTNEDLQLSWNERVKLGSITYTNRKLRTNFDDPTQGSSKRAWGETIDFRLMFVMCPNLETCNVREIYANSLMMSFYDLPALRKVIGTIICSYDSYCDFNMAFHGAFSLESVHIMNLVSNISFKDSPKLGYESYDFLIKNAGNVAKTVTVHPTTYSYLSGTTPPTEQVGGTTEQWQELIKTAAAKNIAFATTE